ncbi:MAG: RIP metalloprotease RseP [Actinobacteria bacterium]|nr:RIP metalloprotease RseP [Actinomycetota bacterium]
MIYLLAVVGLGLIIFVHEFGHFIAGKLMGLTVKEFKFGLPGPEIFGVTVGETRYGVTAIPFGGYVRFAGLESELSIGDEESEDVPDRRNFDKQSIPRKALIIAAGPLMNFIFAIVLFTSLLMIQGEPVGAKPQVNEVAPKSPAADVGIKNGDKIIQIDNKKIRTWQDVLGEIKPRPGKKVTIVIDRGGSSLSFAPILQKGKEGKGFLGITPVVIYKRENPFVALYKGVLVTAGMTALLVKTLFVLVAKQAGLLLKESRGPVGIVQETARIARHGIWDFVAALAFLSVNIGVVNLMPFPPLDGGRIALYGVEGVSGRRLSRKVVLAVSFIGLAILLFFIVYVTIADVIRWLSGAGGL